MQIKEIIGCSICREYFFLVSVQIIHAILRGSPVIFLFRFMSITVYTCWPIFKNFFLQTKLIIFNYKPNLIGFSFNLIQYRTGLKKWFMTSVIFLYRFMSIIHKIFLNDRLVKDLMKYFLVYHIFCKWKQ